MGERERKKGKAGKGKWGKAKRNIERVGVGCTRRKRNHSRRKFSNEMRERK